MRICGISDMHGNLYIGIPKCDVLCICGDIVPLNIQRDDKASATWWNEKFAKYAVALPCKKVIVVPGNHDFYLEKLYNKGDWYAAKQVMSSLTNNKVEILIDESYEYKGIKFYGTPWIKPIDLQKGKWAFEHPTVTEDGTSPFLRIPYCDILLSHDNPNYNHILNYYSSGSYKYHFFGHWHNGTAYNFMNQYNCSLLDDNYNTKKNLIINTIYIMTEEEKQKIEQSFLETLIYAAKTDEVIDFLKQFIVPGSLEEDETEWNTNYSSFIGDYDAEADGIEFEEEKEAA